MYVRVGVYDAEYVRVGVGVTVRVRVGVCVVHGHCSAHSLFATMVQNSSQLSLQQLGTTSQTQFWQEFDAHPGESCSLQQLESVACVGVGVAVGVWVGCVVLLRQMRRAQSSTWPVSPELRS